MTNTTVSVKAKRVAAPGKVLGRPKGSGNKAKLLVIGDVHGQVELPIQVPVAEVLVSDKVDILYTTVQKAAIENARENIRQAMKENGGFTHNLIGMSLLILSKEVSKKAANDLIDEMKITQRYGIQKASV